MLAYFITIALYIPTLVVSTMKSIQIPSYNASISSGVVLDAEEGNNIAKYLGQKKAVILQNVRFKSLSSPTDRGSYIVNVARNFKCRSIGGKCGGRFHPIRICLSGRQHLLSNHSLLNDLE